jgi:AcrR family transcriptional regulator
MANMEKNARRDQILQNALSIVAAKGWASLNVESVAELSDVSSRTIQRFFSGRRSLASALVEYARMKGFKAVAKSGEDLGY